MPAEEWTFADLADDSTPPTQHAWDKYAQDKMIDFLIGEENHFEDRGHHVVAYFYAFIAAATGAWGIWHSWGASATIDWWSLSGLPIALVINHRGNRPSRRKSFRAEAHPPTAKAPAARHLSPPLAHHLKRKFRHRAELADDPRVIEDTERRVASPRERNHPCSVNRQALGPDAGVLLASCLFRFLRDQVAPVPRLE